MLMTTGADSNTRKDLFSDNALTKQLVRRPKKGKKGKKGGASNYVMSSKTANILKQNFFN